MIERLIPRREVLAFIALTADEASAPNEVEFREYEYQGRDWHVIDLTVDSEAAVRFWANAFGHDESRFDRIDHTRDDGSRWTTYRSQEDGWRGFITQVSARVDQPAADVPLDDATAAQLREIAEVAS